MVKNKKGFVKIIEASIAVLIIASILLILINQNVSQTEDIEERIYDIQDSVFREIQLNDSLREEIVNVEDSDLPVEWEEFDDGIVPELEGIKNKIETRIPSNLECVAKLCNPSNNCELNEDIEENVYSRDLILAATLETYNPRRLKLFCW